MKKFFMMFVFFTILSGVNFADSWKIQTISVYKYTSFGLIPQEMDVMYDDGDDSVYLDYDDGVQRANIIFAKSNLLKLREQLKKWAEWASLRDANKISVNKDLPNSFSVPVLWQFGNIYSKANGLLLRMSFVGTEGDGNYMCLSTNTVVSNCNTFVQYYIEGVVVDELNVNALSKYTSENYLSEFKKEVAVKKSQKNLFN